MHLKNFNLKSVYQEISEQNFFYNSLVREEFKFESKI